VTSKRALSLAAGLSLVGLWIAAAFLLWRSSVVPGGLHLGGVDVHRYFGAHELARTARFNRFLTWSDTLSLLATLAAAVAIARWGELWAGPSLAGPVGTGTFLGMVGIAVLWLVGLPFTVADLWWERRHGLVHTGYFTAIFGGWAALAGVFVFVSIALLVVMRLARALGERWWIAAAPVFAGLALLFAFVSPWLQSTHPLHDARLAATARLLEQREGTAPAPVVVSDVSAHTSEPNAEAMGIGASRRIVLWDTILDRRFTRRELRIVIAHEVGHLARNHIWKSIGWSALALVALAFLLARGTRSRGGMGEPEAAPLALLLVVAFSLVALPLENVVSRHIEQEADWQALQAARDPAAQTALFQRFATTTLEQPDPGLLDYVLFENHPTLMQRIALVRAWRARQATSAAQSP
jgi:Zn-dependent protease with chaperone function